MTIDAIITALRGMTLTTPDRLRLLETLKPRRDNYPVGVRIDRAMIAHDVWHSYGAPRVTAADVRAAWNVTAADAVAILVYRSDSGALASIADVYADVPEQFPDAVRAAFPNVELMSAAADAFKLPVSELLAAYADVRHKAGPGERALDGFDDSVRAVLCQRYGMTAPAARNAWADAIAKEATP